MFVREDGLRAQLAPLWRFMRAHSWALFGVFVFVLVQTAAGLFNALYLGATLDAGLGGDLRAFQSAFLVLLVVWWGGDGAFFIRYWLAQNVAERVCFAVRQTAVESISRVALSELEHKHSGDYVSRLSNDINLIRNLVGREWVLLLRGALMFIGSLVVMLMTSWKVTLACITVTPLIMVAAGRLSKPISQHTNDIQKNMADVNSLAQDAAGGIVITKSFNLGKYLAGLFRKASNSVAGSEIKLAFSKGWLGGAMLLLTMAPYFVLFGLGGYEVIQGRLTVGALIIILNLMNSITWPLQAMGQNLAQAKAGLKASQRIFEIVEMPTEKVGGERLEVRPAGPVIEVENVDFSYSPEQKVFEELSFQVQPGETVAVVGPSGAGKSTIFSLLLGLRDPNQGSIKFFGQEVGSLDLDSLRSVISYVPQEATLFPASVQENISYGKPGASAEEITQAAVKAFAHDFILGLPGGYDTVLGEQGVGLSGGQKQRLSLARAILKDAPILLLDEATSALDTESEARVQAAIEEVRAGRTTIIVAHRLSTIKAADRILVIDQGKVVEEGAHATLLSKGGLYAKLYRQQFNDDEACLQVAGA